MCWSGVYSLYAATHLSVCGVNGLPPVALLDFDARSGSDPRTRGAVVAIVQNDGAPPNSRGAGGLGKTLRIDSVPPEPAVPLNLWLELRAPPGEGAVEITVHLARRNGYPPELFQLRDVTARISLLPGLRLESGSLTWTGELRGDRAAQFVARVTAAHDVEGVIEVSAVGHAAGGRVDADSERFRISAHAGGIEIMPGTIEAIIPLKPGDASRVK